MAQTKQRNCFADREQKASKADKSNEESWLRRSQQMQRVSTCLLGKLARGWRRRLTVRHDLKARASASMAGEAQR
eukprot:4738414-Pleurochrysis_carterae.AAC.1